MPRANRHHIPGQVWHITHRCHKKEFLLKFTKDRQKWLDWLFEAKKRFGVCVLNYVVTSNHIHLLVVDSDQDVIPRTLQLAAGRTAQQFNRRKGRKGAFWEDRYHATAVEAGAHLLRCLVYIDLNMVRAGVVYHPSEWPHGGYQEIQSPPSRYRLIDRSRLVELCGLKDEEQLSRRHREWVEEALRNGGLTRQSEWTTSLAVGDVAFVTSMKETLKIRATGREVRKSGDAYALREPSAPYNPHFEVKKEPLSADNTVSLPLNVDNSKG